ncbi:metal ABC transporter permease [Fusobacterium necrophorum]|uniref:Metal ABC transporter permease n=1 Tax=Fusobacterium necrophorum DJ-2 TaxID=1441737 RepID=A0AB73C457_9FUSO|nr:metal ABC transporter permease [Fusobacterium necrophorum]KDE62738.1 metal ABC transporter permease [Fusobacterium necrophorum BFTR-1]KDE67952.1 metal ABC transporter permease [Fusobacterium necrophorum DJ-1]KDE72765.1 metal ABC transporter permease [Fusobacterium necrophorum DJ-2]MBR8732942.1 High-affinity zinc uptake system membrane protein ZnuB [Fusobacterium necrophorum]MBR8789024.1 High-affinity zinc uptake system membrane protein ZnuB [Fusobacterium necrophorum]
MLQYEFMQKAFLVGILVSIIVPCIGSFVVLKRLSMLGDALSHASLSGVALGLLLAWNPLVGAFLACVVAAFGTEYLREKIPEYSEISIAIITSLGVGLAGVLSSFIKNATSFHSFLFGSIVAISTGEVMMIACISVVVIFVFLFFYKELFYIAFDEEGAKVAGVPVNQLNFLVTLITAMTVSIASRTVGALMISSFMVLPMATAMQVARSYRSTILFAVFYALISTLSGLSLSYYYGLKPGGTIVLLSVGIFFWNLFWKHYARNQ